MSNLFDLSQTPALNNSTPPDGSPEGCLPSTLNNTIRQLMANAAGAFACYTGGGTANAHTVTMSPALAAYSTKVRIAYIPPANNTAAYTVNVNGLGAVSVKMLDGTDPPAGAANSSGVSVIQHNGTNFVLLNPAVLLGITVTAAKINAACNFVTGSFTKTSVTNNSFASVQSITHGLGTDEVSLEVCVSTSGAGTPGMWSLQWYGPSKRGTTILGPSGFEVTLGDRTSPASGVIDIYLHNNSANTRTYTVAYKISAL